MGSAYDRGKGGRLSVVVFVAVGLFWCIVFSLAEPLYDWGVRLRRKMGMVRVADFAERMKRRVLPPAWLALVIMALISFVAAIL